MPGAVTVRLQPGGMAMASKVHRPIMHIRDAGNAGPAGLMPMGKSQRSSVGWGNSLHREDGVIHGT